MIVKLNQTETIEIDLNKSNILTDEKFIEYQLLFIPINLTETPTYINMFTCEDNCVSYDEEIEFTYMLSCKITGNQEWNLSVISGDCTSSYEVKLFETELSYIENNI